MPRFRSPRTAPVPAPRRRPGDAWRAAVERRRARRLVPVAEPRPSWLRQLAFVFVLLSQLVGVALTVEEGRGGLGAGTHIEAVGTRAHYAHDETTCGACHLRSMHGGLPTAPRLALLRDLDVVEHGLRASTPPAAYRILSNTSRAPPSVI